jgi:hypothetical protein
MQNVFQRHRLAEPVTLQLVAASQPQHFICFSFSTPSATTIMPSALAIRTVPLTSAAACSSSSTSPARDLSILIVSKLKRRR